MNWLKKQHKNRCAKKVALPWEDLAEGVAQKMTRKYGKLLICYECCDCGAWHVGHADATQIAAHIPPQGSLCSVCWQTIPKKRLEAARQCGSRTTTCSPRCAKKARRRRLRQNKRARKQAAASERPAQE